MRNVNTGPVKTRALSNTFGCKTFVFIHPNFISPKQQKKTPKREVNSIYLIFISSATSQQEEEWHRIEHKNSSLQHCCRPKICSSRRFSFIATVFCGYCIFAGLLFRWKIVAGHAMDKKLANRARLSRCLVTSTLRL